jgi:hypothetical protein
MAMKTKMTIWKNIGACFIWRVLETSTICNPI